MKQISDLPPEILVKCFLPLAPPDLKSCVLVSSLWRAVGEDPRLWTWCILTISSREDLHKLAVRRISKIQKIRINTSRNLWEDGDWKAFFQAAQALPELREIEGLGYRNLGCLEAEAMAGAVVKLEEADLGNSMLSTEQITAILTNIHREYRKLKKLNLSLNNLPGVQPEALGRALILLEDVDLRYTGLTTEQVNNILVKVGEEDTKLRKINLKENNLSGVDPEDLAKALIKLEELDLEHTELSTAQTSAIFMAIAKEDTKLKKLILFGENLSGVEPEALARALIKLEDVDLSCTKLSTEQISSILTNIVSQQIKLKKLNLLDNDLANVEPEVVGRAVRILEEIKYNSPISITLP